MRKLDTSKTGVAQLIFFFLFKNNFVYLGKSSTQLARLVPATNVKLQMADQLEDDKGACITYHVYLTMGYEEGLINSRLTKL